MVVSSLVATTPGGGAGVPIAGVPIAGVSIAGVDSTRSMGATIACITTSAVRVAVLSFIGII